MVNKPNKPSDSLRHPVLLLPLLLKTSHYLFPEPCAYSHHG
jgi:hypothetical protein